MNGLNLLFMGIGIAILLFRNCNIPFDLIQTFNFIVNGTVILLLSLR